MNRHQLFTIIFGVLCGVFLFAPVSTLSALLRVKWKSRLWTRLVGAFGFLSIAFGCLANELAGTLNFTRAERAVFLMLRFLCSGIMIGLLLAMVTRRFEDR